MVWSNAKVYQFPCRLLRKRTKQFEREKLFDWPGVKCLDKKRVDCILTKSKWLACILFREKVMITIKNVDTLTLEVNGVLKCGDRELDRYLQSVWDSNRHTSSIEHGDVQYCRLHMTAHLGFWRTDGGHRRDTRYNKAIRYMVTSCVRWSFGMGVQTVVHLPSVFRTPGSFLFPSFKMVFTHDTWCAASQMPKNRLVRELEHHRA